MHSIEVFFCGCARNEACYNLEHAPVAQWIERGTPKAEVVGSIPARGAQPPRLAKPRGLFFGLAWSIKLQRCCKHTAKLVRRAHVMLIEISYRSVGGVCVQLESEAQCEKDIRRMQQ
jgi:hypothetical protein